MAAARVGVIVLGAAGMLGRTCLHRLRRLVPNWYVDGTSRSAEGTYTFDVEDGKLVLDRLLGSGRYRYAINCVGVLQADINDTDPASVSRAVTVNALFPHVLASAAAACETRVFHVSSDAVFSGRVDVPLAEETPADPADTYGRTKLLGESCSNHVLNIRCSIVGRDPRGRGLTEWYLRSDPSETVRGFIDYIWTPVTVIQLVDLIHGAMVTDAFNTLRRAGPVVHFAPNAALSKFEYLTALRSLSARGAPVEEGRSPAGPCRRVLVSSDVLAERLPPPKPWSAALRELLSDENGVQHA